MLQQLQYECLFSYHIESGITKLSIPNFCFWSDPPSPQYIASVSVVDWWLCYWNMTWVIWCHGGVTREWWWDIAPSGFVLSTFSQGTSPTIFNIITHSVWFPCDTMLTMQKKKSAGDVNHLRNEVITCNVSSWNSKVQIHSGSRIQKRLDGIV